MYQNVIVVGGIAENRREAHVPVAVVAQKIVQVCLQSVPQRVATPETNNDNTLKKFKYIICFTYSRLGTIRHEHV